MSASTGRPRVLCVDDEADVLEGLKDLLHRDCEVLTSTSGFEALRLATEEDVDVVVTDMRMPQIDGAKLMALLRRHAPLVTRVLLTGHADLDAAARAVNEGGCHRFLQKPAEPAELLAIIRSGTAERRQRQAERDVLERTVGGVVQVLGEVLGAFRPSAQGESVHLLALCEHAAAQLGHEPTWALRAAAALAPLGALVEPDAHHRRLEAAARLLVHIPRFEEVAAILAPEEPLSREAQLLHGAVLLSAVADRGVALARAGMRGCDDDVVEALAIAADAVAEVGAVVDVRLGSVEPGMVLAEDVRRADGTLLVARGVEVGQLLAARLATLTGDEAAARVLVRTGPARRSAP